MTTEPAVPGALVIPVLLITLTGACAPSSASRSRYAEVPLSDIMHQPGAYAGRVVQTRGHVVASGTVPEGTWIELAPTKAALVQSMTGNPGTYGLAARRSLVVLLPVAAVPGTLDDLQAKELELRLRVEGEVTLADGRRALRAVPLAILTAVQQIAPGDERPEDVEAIAAAWFRGAQADAAQHFGDPGLEAGARLALKLRVGFVDPELPRPGSFQMEPLRFERTDAAVAPEYVYRTVARLDAGATQEVRCRLRLEDEALRSRTYEEILRDPAGGVIEERRIDFTSATGGPGGGPWPANVYASSCVLPALMGYPFETKRIVRFLAWTDAGAVVPMSARLDGREAMAVPAGRFDCHRIRVQTAAASETAADLPRPPDTVLWYMAVRPHLFVKMIGRIGGPDTARAVLELAALDSGSRAALAAAAERLIDEIWARPERFAGETVELRFEVAAVGHSNGGQWLEPRRSGRSAEPPRFFVAGSDRSVARGERVDWRAEIGQPMSLDVGGRAIVLHLTEDVPADEAVQAQDAGNARP